MSRSERESFCFCPGGIVQLLREGYSERLFLHIDERGEWIVRKQSKPEIKGTLLAEIAWLEELPPTLQRYFPKVLRVNKQNGNGQTIFYDMPYFGRGWTLLSDLILSQRLDRERTLALITQVMQIMFRGIFPTTYPEEERGYPDKLVLLLERCAQQIRQLPAFSSLISSETLSISRTTLWNVYPLLEVLKSVPSTKAKLCPIVVRKVHGDLYPENVLVYVPSLAQSVPQIVLLDPLAALGLSRGDFAVDIAKFTSWLSAELLALRLGLFSVRGEQSDIPTFILTFHTEDAQLRALSDRSLLRAFVQLIDTAEWARSVCDTDPDWWQRVSFYEALYALSMVPLVPFPQSLARFLVGVRHLHNSVCAEVRV